MSNEKFVENMAFVRRCLNRRASTLDYNEVRALKNGKEMMDVILKNECYESVSGITREINITIALINEALAQSKSLGRKKMLLYVKYRNQLKTIRRNATRIIK